MNTVNAEKCRVKRQRLKAKIDSLKTGGCVLCGYKKCLSALHFHHVLSDKETMISDVGSFAQAKHEIKKCILVCANCHTEIHAGQIENISVVQRVPRQEEPPLLKLINGAS